MNITFVTARFPSARRGLNPLFMGGLFAVCLALLAPLSAHAGYCTSAQGVRTLSINLGAITVQRNLPIGAEIASVVYPAGKTLIADSCTDSADVQADVSSTFPAQSLPIFRSGVAGVGLKIQIQGKEMSNTTMGSTLPHNGSDPVYNPEIKVTLVKTGNITPGSVTQGELLTLKGNNSANQQYALLNANITGGVVTQASCEITGSSVIPVKMGEAKVNAFDGKGSTLPPKDIQIPLMCDSGTKVNISFAATSSLGKGIIDLAYGGAEGVGIQLKLNDIPVRFDQTLFVAQATEQGAFNIPLTAAYIKTSDTIKTGFVNAVANFTVTYE
jgi:type 1 fimbria pilin